MGIKRAVKGLPILGTLATSFSRRLFEAKGRFRGSEAYWIRRYEEGGHSGNRSYRKLAEFKADVLNRFVEEKGIQSVIEFGWGDGNQLTYARYPKYIGLDISAAAIRLCQEKFGDDSTKVFKLIKNYANESADLALSLDVVYHLVEDNVFHQYMIRLFDSSTSYVIVYSSNMKDGREEGRSR